MSNISASRHTAVLANNGTATTSRARHASRRVQTAQRNGIVACSGLLVGAFFLRSSSVPTGLTSQQLFLACCASLILASVYLITSRRLTYSSMTLTFVLLTLPSLQMAEELSTSGLRWVGWLLIVAAVGPLFIDELRLKLQVLDWTRQLLLICTVGSLLLNLVGIRLSGRGIFFGLMGHAMILAPISALAAIDLFCTRKHKRSTWKTALLVICCVTCIGAGSRGAVVGLTLGILTHVAHRREGFLVVTVAVLVLLGVTYLQPGRTSDDLNTVLSEGVYSELTTKGTNNTRAHLWAARIEEFVGSPVIGVGFQQQQIYRKDTEEKFLEPGSSYLAVLSMTGILGMIGFVWLAMIVFSSLYTTTSAIPDEYKDLLRGWMAFFAVHLVIEGYIFACGSLLCFLLWLTIGCSISLHHMGQRRQIQLRKQSHLRVKSNRQRAANETVALL